MKPDSPDEEHPEGQKWGMPTYDFAKQKKNGFRVWRQRIAWMARYFDIIRIGHFRAMDTYWRIPADKPARDGKWILGPRGPMEAILESAGDRQIVAEDLGMPRPEVAELREAYGIQGMDVLQYRMDTKALKNPTNPAASCTPATMTTPHWKNSIRDSIRTSGSASVASSRNADTTSGPSMTWSASMCWTPTPRP